MSSIWHTKRKKPKENKTIFAQHKSFRGGTIECFMWEKQEFTDAIRKDVIAWCYLDDLLACEQELIRTRKALEIALDAIDKGEAALIGCQEADDKYISDVTAEDGLELMSKAYKQIKVLEQKDNKCQI